VGDFSGIVQDTAVVLVTGTAAVFDLRTRRIPSQLTVLATLGGLLYGVFTLTPSQFGWLVGFTASMFACGFLLYVATVLGGGDGKLLTCVAALTGPGMFAERMAWLLVSGVVVSIAVLAWARALLPLLRRLAGAVRQWTQFGVLSNPLAGYELHRMPFAVVILIGVVLSIVARRAHFWLLR
jgi:Flp pilus assembly protein protease CpaA